MTYTEAISILKKAIDNVSKALDRFYEEIPKYLRTEMLHPKKKPRGSIRRKRKGRESK
jgi:prefoldin subunit 5